MGDLSKSQNGAKRLQQMSGSDSTSVSSWLMQTTHGARAQPTRTDTAVRPYPVEHECRAWATARARCGSLNYIYLFLVMRTIAEF